MTSSPNVTELLVAWSRGDRDALDALMPVVYGELRRIARGHLARERRDHTLQTTALVHEAYLRLVRDEGLQWSSRAEFYVAAGRAMQRILVEHARKRKRLKRRGDPRPIIADVVDLATTASLEDVVAVHDAIDRLEVSL